jgi:hypothetical protein
MASDKTRKLWKEMDDMASSATDAARAQQQDNDDDDELTLEELDALLPR